MSNSFSGKVPDIVGKKFTTFKVEVWFKSSEEEKLVENLMQKIKDTNPIGSDANEFAYRFLKGMHGSGS